MYSQYLFYEAQQQGSLHMYFGIPAIAYLLVVKKPQSKPLITKGVQLAPEQLITGHTSKNTDLLL